MTLVISETIQHDIKSGIKVAIAPIITDLPIIVFTLLVLSKISNFNEILGIISLAGGCFVLYMGYKNLCIKGVELNLQDIKSKSLTKGVIANVLSPHPYLFWISVGAPIMSKAMSQNVSSSLAFIISFYAFLVGSKIVLALFIGKSRSFVVDNTYIYTMRILGLILCVLAIVLFHDGLKLLGII